MHSHSLIQTDPPFAAELVPGDLIEVGVGGKVPADVRVTQLQSTMLRIDQASSRGRRAVSWVISIRAVAAEHHAGATRAPAAASRLLHGSCSGQGE